MSDMKFLCPHCQQHFQCDESYSGREISCPACHAQVSILQFMAPAEPKLFPQSPAALQPLP